MPTRIASIDLRVRDVPDDVVVSAEEGVDEDERVGGLQPLIDFGHTFNGYAYGGAPHQLAPIVDDVEQRWRDGMGLPTDLDRLRACLFYWARGHAHGTGESASPADARWLNALLAAIRTGLADRH